MKISLDNSDPLMRTEKDVFQIKINPDDLSVSNNEVVLSMGYSNEEKSFHPNRPDSY